MRNGHALNAVMRVDLDKDKITDCG